MSLNPIPMDPLASFRQAVQRPVRQAFGADRFPEEQYTEPAGDPGLFGPGSATWVVHGDAAMLIGGVSAVILQSLHPLAMAGVADHSDWKQRPFQRLSRTSSFVTATTFGATPVVDAIIDTVKAVHTKVVGTAPDGRHYEAGDPDLLRWIHVAEVSSFLAAHRRFGLLPITPADQDRYYDEVRVVAERLGATRVPRSRAEVAAYFEAVRPELIAGRQAREAVHDLMNPHFPDRAVQAGYMVAIHGAIALLPDWARRMLRLNERPAFELVTTRASVHALLNTLRVAGGGAPIPLRQAWARCSAPSGS
ncbi:MAG: oxygenase MpaB family protein [Acidimicrobiales bacterium]